MLLPGEGGNSEYLWGHSAFDAFLVGCNVRWKMEENEKLARSTPFGEYRYQRVKRFYEKMKSMGFYERGDDAHTLSHSLGYVVWESQLWEVEPNKLDDVIFIRGMETHKHNKSKFDGIKLLVKLLKAADYANVILLGCPHAFYHTENGELAYDNEGLAERGLPNTLSLKRMYERLGFKIHPTLKSEPNKMDLMYYEPNGYTCNPYPYEEPPKEESKPPTIANKNTMDNLPANQTHYDMSPDWRGYYYGGNPLDRCYAKRYTLY